MKKTFSYFPPIIFFIFFLFSWEFFVGFFNISPQILPVPSAIFSAFVDQFLILLPHVEQTLLETIIGLLFAIVLGVSTAIMLDTFSLVRKTIYPFLVISQTIPMIALAPLLLLWFGFSLLPKVIIVTLYCFFPITVSFFDGIRLTDENHLSLLKSMHASKRQQLFHAKIPAALPSFFSGLRIAATYAITGAIVGEYVGAYQGLGIYMQQAANSYAIAFVFVAIALTAFLSLCLFLAVKLLEYIFVPWKR